MGHGDAHSFLDMRTKITVSDTASIKTVGKWVSPSTIIRPGPMKIVQGRIFIFRQPNLCALCCAPCAGSSAKENYKILYEPKSERRAGPQGHGNVARFDNNGRRRDGLILARAKNCQQNHSRSKCAWYSFYSYSQKRDNKYIQNWVSYIPQQW